MGRQFRGTRVKADTGASGDFREFVTMNPSSGAFASNAAAKIPSYGVTDISTWAASTYFMAPPVAGTIKTFVSHNSTAGAAARVIALSTIPAGTTAAGSVTIGTVGATSGAGGNTHLSFGASTADICVTMMGVNTTHWVMVSSPTTTSTGFVGIVSTA